MFHMIETDDTLELKMSATLQAVEDADDCMSAWLARRQVPVSLFAMRLVIHEVLVNAVTHGSGSDAARTVAAWLELRAGELALTVEDSGAGFDHSKSRRAEVLGASGRGLTLMELYSDSVQFNQRGNRVTVIRKLEPGRTALAPADSYKEQLQ